MIMLYITIIFVVILATICVLGWKYIHAIYETPDSRDSMAIDCIHSLILDMLRRYAKYDATDDKDKYMYMISEKDIRCLLNTIRNIIEINRISDVDFDED